METHLVLVDSVTTLRIETTQTEHHRLEKKKERDVSNFGGHSDGVI